MRNMLKPPPSPISGEGESLSEWFRPLGSPTASPSECSSLSIPFAELAISFMDDASESASHNEIEEKDKEHDGLSHTSQACASIRGLSENFFFVFSFHVKNLTSQQKCGVLSVVLHFIKSKNNS